MDVQLASTAPKQGGFRSREMTKNGHIDSIIDGHHLVHPLIASTTTAIEWGHIKPRPQTTTIRTAWAPPHEYRRMCRLCARPCNVVKSMGPALPIPDLCKLRPYHHLSSIEARALIYRSTQASFGRPNPRGIPYLFPGPGSYADFGPMEKRPWIWKPTTRERATRAPYFPRGSSSSTQGS